MSADEERLMQLFQNRAGLKKAYADLKDEFHLLRDRLKQQEGATIRVQEQLDALGDLLADPRTGFGALVFFQLRGLWKTCHQQLSAFATELTRQQEARETAKHKADCDAAKSARLADVDQRLQAAADDADLQREHLNDAQTRAATLDRVVALLQAPPAPEVARLSAARRGRRRCESVGELHAERSAIDNEAIAEFPGISLAARRNINLAIISYAEILCEHVDAFGLAARAKEAVARRVHEMSFGTRAGLRGLHAAGAEGADRGCQSEADHRRRQSQAREAARHLRIPQRRRYRADRRFARGRAADADAAKAGRPATPASWNVLAEDYWDLYTLLLR